MPFGTYSQIPIHVGGGDGDGINAKQNNNINSLDVVFQLIIYQLLKYLLLFNIIKNIKKNDKNKNKSTFSYNNAVNETVHFSFTILYRASL